LTQINKGQDGKRKHELTQLNKVFEDYYNDKQCYPKPGEVCYNTISPTTCNICGNESAPPSFSIFSPYLSRLPCDPRQPTKKYLYQVDNSSCPTWYRIYTTLSNTVDPVIVSVGCSNGCGPTDDKSYNYGVTSPNTDLEKNFINQYACLPGGCAYCCYGPDCGTPCSTNPSDYCNENVYIVNDLNICTTNCSCP